MRGGNVSGDKKKRCKFFFSLPYFFLHESLLVLQSVIQCVELLGFCQCGRNWRQVKQDQDQIPGTHAHLHVNHAPTL